MSYRGNAGRSSWRLSAPLNASATSSPAARSTRWNGSSQYPTSSRKKNFGSEPDSTTRPLGPVLLALTHADLRPQEDRATLEDDITSYDSYPTISHTEYIASYSWLNEKTPTIVVPGTPPAWTPLASPQKLPEDSGNFFRDPNAARFPTYPTEPAIQAIFKEHPSFQTTDIDIFACGSTLGNLLRFARGVDNAFRFSVEVIGNTVFLIRKENSPTELIPNVRGYGHTFPEAYTTWDKDVMGSESHQRLIKYRFGGLDCVVRFTCDGYLPGHPGAASAKATRKAAAPAPLDPVSLADAFTAASISPAPSSAGASLQIETAGLRMPQAAIFDLKTRSNKHKLEIDMADVYPRLWLTQIPNFVVGYHSGNGIFRDIDTKDVRPDLQRWERENANALVRFAELMKKIVDMARALGGKLEIYRPDIDSIQIRKQLDESDALLPELKAKWVQRKGTPTAKEPTMDKTDEPAWEDDFEENIDYTACSESCGYCGHCTY